MDKALIHELLRAIEAVVSAEGGTWKEKAAQIQAEANDSSDSGISLNEFIGWFPDEAG